MMRGTKDHGGRAGRDGAPGIGFRAVLEGQRVAAAALAGFVLRTQPTMRAGMLERVSPPVFGADRNRAIAEKIERR